MFVKLHKINSGHSGEYYLSEVRINSSHIVFITENSEMRALMKEGKINLSLNEMAHFSDILISSKNGSSKITVVGDPEFIESKINTSRKQLLRG